MSKLRFRTLIKIIPVLFAIHNLEESFYMHRWLRRNLPLLEGIFGVQIPIHYSAYQLNISLFISVVVVLVLALICVDGQKNGWKIRLIILIQATLLVNAIFPHIAWAIMLFKYAPGLTTAIFVDIPYSIYFFKRALDEEYITKRMLLYISLFAFPAYLVLIFIYNSLGEYLANLFHP